MATKVYFVPYVRGPKLDSDAAQSVRVDGLKQWFKKLRTIAAVIWNSPGRLSTDATTDARSHWAYRVVNYRQAAAGEAYCQCRQQSPLPVEVCDLELEAIAPAKLRPGDIIVVEAGETIFADGTILAGTAIVDESAITGQSEPLVCSADHRATIMRDSGVIAGRILVRVADRRGHPLDWIDTPPAPHVITQSALRRTAVRS